MLCGSCRSRCSARERRTVNVHKMLSKLFLLSGTHVQ